MGFQDMVFGIAFAGTGMAILRDYYEKRLEKHFFYLTRLSYYCMFFTICMYNTSWYPYMLNVFAPLSLNVYVGYYYGMTTPLRGSMSGESYAAHFLMPLMAMYMWFEDTTTTSWYFFLWLFIPVGVHTVQQYLYFKLFKKDIYDFHLLSWTGVWKMAGMFGVAMALCLSKSLLGSLWLSVPWYVPTLVAMAMIVGAMGDIVVDERRTRDKKQEGEWILL